MDLAGQECAWHNLNSQKFLKSIKNVQKYILCHSLTLLDTFVLKKHSASMTQQPVCSWVYIVLHYTCFQFLRTYGCEHVAEWPHYFNISPFSFQIAWGMQALTFQHHLKFSCWENLREVSFSQIVGVSGYWREHGGREKCLFQFQPVDLIHRLAYACFKHKKSTYWNTELTTTCQSDRFWWKRVCAKKNKPIKYYFC